MKNHVSTLQLRPQTIRLLVGAALLPTGAAAAQVPPRATPEIAAYQCIIRVVPRSGPATTYRLAYDRGRFREEQLDPSGGRRAMRLYQRDGQGIAFRTVSGRSGLVGVDLPSVLYRLSKSNPERLRRITGHPTGIEREPAPTLALERFVQRPGEPPFRRVGAATIDGKSCVEYERGSGRIDVWRGYVVAQRRPDVSVTITNLRVAARLPAALFRLPAGTTAKVPHDLHVKLPAGVRRVEYPGDGLLEPGARG